ncbi:hypothetical protein [Parasediminibacterium sp. JCM 36343]|uniref:hypothetical protein n=1 Tax=Parasediminibacterium sp. JCM 36343 TaxID=3374279 RepID=UPI003979CA5F
MKKNAFFLFLIIAAATSTALAKNNTDIAFAKALKDPTNPIAGKWVRQFSGVSVLLTANADYTSSISVNGHVTSTGTYVVKDNVVTLINKTEPRNHCIGVEGFYTYTIKDGKMTMAAKNDPCEGRAQAVEGIWTKQ